MYSTFSIFFCLLIIVNCCNGSRPASQIVLQFFRGKVRSHLIRDTDSVSIDYNKGDSVDFLCSSTFEASKEPPFISWIDGAEETRPSQKTSISQTKLLDEADDGTELVCMAVSADGKKKSRIPISFVLIKSSKPLNLFSILLMVGGGLIITALVVIVVYGVIRRCKNRKGEDVGTEDASLENQKVIFSETQKNRGILDSPNQDDHIMERGIDNLSCIQESPSYVKFDRPDDSCDGINYIHDNVSHDNKSHDNDQVQNAIRKSSRNENGVRMSLRNRYSSSDC